MSAQTAADIRAAMALIDTPEKWCQGRYIVRGNSKNAVRRCASRALLEATGLKAMTARYYNAAHSIRQASGNSLVGIPTINDTNTHAQLMEWMELAARKEERTS